MRAIKWTLLLLVLLFFTRGFLFKRLISYQSEKTRNLVVISDEEFLRIIDLGTKGISLTIEDINQISYELTANQLSFTFGKASSIPDEVIKNQNANCVGYAALQTAIAQYLIKKYHLKNDMEVIHHVGTLSALGVNLHQFSSNPFFKDHDYVEIKNRKSGKSVLCDPSLYDFFWLKKP